MKPEKVSRARGGWFILGIFLVLSCLALQTSAQEVLLVYGAGKLKGGDDKLADHLLEQGYTLTLLSDHEVAVEDSRGKDLVILSDSVDSTLLGAMFREAKVPVLCAEHQQLDDLGLTELRYGTDFGKAPRRIAMKITDSSNTLAAGLRGGVRVSTDPYAMGWGVPGANAVKVGLLGGSDAANQKFALFEYEAGTPMPGLVAPAKRIGLLLSTSAFAHLTSDGKKLLDSAVDHAVRASEGGCVPCQSGEHQITFKNNSTETIWVGIWSGPANTGYDSKDPHMPGWKLDAGESGTWCAPYGFNGGIFPRTKCMTDDGKLWIGCDSGDCGGDTPRCTTGHQPASFCEFTFDDANKKTWYDVSYVDAYTFPMQVKVDNYTGTPDHGQNWCWTAGCTSLPACPWDTHGDKICYGACREWESRHPDYITKAYAQHLAVCCKCTDDQHYPGCTCRQDCCTNGCGCSPNANPPDPLAQQCKDPFTMQGATQCDWNKNGTGPSLDPTLDYTKYAKAIKDVCADSYTWTYHDQSGDMNCKNDDDTALNFTVTFGPR